MSLPIARILNFVHLFHKYLLSTLHAEGAEDGTDSNIVKIPTSREQANVETVGKDIVT